MATKFKIETKMIGNLVAKLEVEVFDGNECDTTVRLGQHALCTVPGYDREAFIQEINEVINKYRI